MIRARYAPRWRGSASPGSGRQPAELHAADPPPSASALRRRIRSPLRLRHCRSADWRYEQLKVQRTSAPHADTAPGPGGPDPAGGQSARRQPPRRPPSGQAFKRFLGHHAACGRRCTGEAPARTCACGCARRSADTARSAPCRRARQRGAAAASVRTAAPGAPTRDQPPGLFPRWSRSAAVMATILPRRGAARAARHGQRR